MKLADETTIKIECHDCGEESEIFDALGEDHAGDYQHCPRCGSKNIAVGEG